MLSVDELPKFASCILNILPVKRSYDSSKCKINSIQNIFLKAI